MSTLNVNGTEIRFSRFNSADCIAAYKDWTRPEPETANTWVTYYPTIEQTVDYAFELLQKDISLMFGKLYDNTESKLNFH